MLMAVFTSFAASRKEPLGDTVERVHAAFVTAGFGEPVVRVSILDPHDPAELSTAAAAPGIKRVSSVDRILKRWPELAPLVRLSSTSATRKVISNLTDSGAVTPIDFAILKEIARGVPKSFPCHRITLHFSARGFSQGPDLPPAPDPTAMAALARAGVNVVADEPIAPGVSVTDSWWVNGRQRSLRALRLVEADAAAKQLPAAPANVQAVLAASGKARKTVQVPLVVAPTASTGVAAEAATPQGALTSEMGEALRAVLRDYREKMDALLQRLPHDLPPDAEPPGYTLAGTPAIGPKKPELIKAFAPLGYTCRGEHGDFKLQRKTEGNLAVQIRVEIGGWGTTINASIHVIGLANAREQEGGSGQRSSCRYRCGLCEA